MKASHEIYSFINEQYGNFSELTFDGVMAQKILSLTQLKPYSFGPDQD
jgi:hypothetical protein